MLQRLQELEESALGDLSAVGDADALEQWRITYIGAMGKLKSMAAGL